MWKNTSYLPAIGWVVRGQVSSLLSLVLQVFLQEPLQMGRGGASFKQSVASFSRVGWDGVTLVLLASQTTSNEKNSPLK